MPALLDTQITVFQGKLDTDAREQLSLGAMLERIQGGMYRQYIEGLRALREAWGKDAYDQQKGKSYAFTPCCALTSRARKVPWPDKLISTTGVVYFDIDDVDEPEAVKAELARDPRVLFAFTSPSGQGVKVGVAAEGITGPNDYKEVWAALLAEFQQTYPAIVFKVDDHVKFLNALCYVSHDPALYSNPDAQRYVVPPSQKPAPKPKATRTTSTARSQAQTTRAGEQARVEDALTYIPADDYDTWLRVGMALHASGQQWARAAWDTWSQRSDKYDAAMQDEKWSSFTSTGGVNLATVFHLAQQYGYALPRPSMTVEQRPAVPDMTNPAPKAQNTSVPDEESPQQATTTLIAILPTLADDAKEDAILTAMPALAGVAMLDWIRLKRQLKAAVPSVNLNDLERARSELRRTLAAQGPSADLLDQVEQETSGRAPGVDACPYENTPAGIVRHTWRDKEEITTRLTNFTAAILADVLEDDGVETRLFFELGARLDGQPQTFKIPASQFAGMNWVTEHMGGSAIIMPGMGLKDHARAAIQMLSPGIAARHIYTHIGWRQLDTGWVYLHAGGAVGAEGLLADVTVEPDNALAPFVLHVPETPVATQAALLASMQMLTAAPPHIVVPLYGALWRALLGTCDLSVHLTGDTGMGKSELAALVQQHWGKAMDAKHLPASWTSTANALEVQAFQAKDAILVIDDFCPRGSPAEVSQLHGKADRVLRAQGNRSARQRLDRTGRDRPAKPPRGLIVSTGEDIPQGQSLRARICILEVTPATVDWPRLSPCQADAAAGLYTQALAAFVQWLAPHYGNVIEMLPQELITLRAAAVQTAHRRTPELIANLALGWRYFLACAHDCGVLSAAECEQFWGWAWCTLGEVGSAQQVHQADDNPVARFLALLRGAITAGLAHVQDARTYEHPAQAQDWGWSVRDITSTRPDDASQVWTPHGACIGYLDDTRLYLEPEAAYSVVQRMAETQRAPLSLTQRTLHKRMAEQGLLTTQPSQARHTIAKRLGPSQALKRVLDIAVSSLVPLYAATTGNFGNNGNTEAKKQENQRLDTLPLPSWRGSKPVTRSTKPVTCSGAVPGSVTGSADDVTGFSPSCPHK